MNAISVTALSADIALNKPSVLVDVRREKARHASAQTIAGAVWRDPAHWLDWKDELAAGPTDIVFFCVHGHEISQAMTAALCAMGQRARYLSGGFAQWQADGRPVVGLPSSL
jgi:rhodanese-related sulfurtransferase